jgi:chemotaxis protein MotB
MTKNYDKLNETYDLLLSKNKELLAGNVEENKKLIGSLQSTQEQLQRKEDELKKLADELEARKKNLDALKVDLDFSKQELQKREARLAELENILKQKDQAVLDLKRKVQDALLGFENKGLTITQKNGKIYVSLDESLLFASGSTKVEEKGVEALKKLAKVLEQNNDINVLVEGHTDDVPMAGKGDIKDNWDLSVMRATSIVKIITSNSKIDPTRLTAAGRGEYFPIDNAKTPEARKKNRRTEIILTPKLDELLKVLETN